MPSSVIAYYNYDRESAILKITFVSGLVYEYLEVPVNIYQAMKNARSKGVYFNKHVKNIYSFRKVGEAAT